MDIPDSHVGEWIVGGGKVRPPRSVVRQLHQMGYQVKPTGERAYKIHLGEKTVRMSPRLEPVERVRFQPFQAADEVMHRLRNLKGIQHSEGLAALESIVETLSGVEGGPRLRVLGAERGRPVVQLAVGGEVVNLPFQVAQGEAVQGASTLAVRGVHLRPGVDPISYSQALSRTIGCIGDEAAQPGFLGRAVRWVNRQLSEPATYGGRRLTSVMETRGQQVIANPGSELHDLNRQVRQRIVGMHKNAALDPAATEAAWHKVNQQLDELHQRVYDEGYGIQGLKFETSKSVLVMSRQGALIPAQNWMDIARGQQQLLQREVLPDRLLRAAFGDRRINPWLVVPGEAHRYAMPANLMVIGGEAGEALIGDSAYIAGNEGMNRVMGAAMPGRSVKVHLPLQTVEGGGQEIVGAKLAPWLRKILYGKVGDERLVDVLARDATYRFETPKDLPAFNRERILVGRSGRTVGPSGELTYGRTIETIERGHRLAGVSLVPGEGSAQLTLDFLAPAGQLETGRGGILLPGGVRASQRSSVYGIEGVDLIARSADVFKNPASLSNVYGAHWLALAEANGLDPRLVAKEMGLNPVAYRGGVSFEAAGEWRVTPEMEEKVARIFRVHGKETVAQQLRGIPVSDLGPAYGDLLAQARAKGLSLESVLSDSLVFLGVPISVRSKVGMGLKNRSGVRLRIDQFMQTIRQATMGGAGDISAHAQRIMDFMMSRNPRLMAESANLFGPLFGKGPGAGALSLADLGKMLPPNLQQGGSARMLEGSLFSPGFKGAWIDVGSIGQIWPGTKRELGKGTRKAISTTGFWLGSAEMMGVRADEMGAFHMNPVMRQALKVTKMARELAASGGKPGEAFWAEANRYQHLMRKQLAGKKGTLSLQARPLGGQTSRLHMLSTAADDALSIAMSEQKIRQMYGRDAEAVLAGIREKGYFMVSAGAWPQKGPMAYQPGVKLELLTEQEIANELARHGKTSLKSTDVVRAGQAFMWGSARDQDLDTFFSIVDRSPEGQAIQERIYARNSAVFREYRKLVTESSKAKSTAEGMADAMAEGLGESRAGKDFIEAQIAGSRKFYQTKYGTPIPEVFYRARAEIANWASAAREGVNVDVFGHDPMWFLRQIQGEGLAKGPAALTRLESAAMDAFQDMYSQGFLTKQGTASFRVMREIVALQSGPGKEGLRPLREAMTEAVATVKDTYFRLPMLEKLGITSRSEAEAFIVEHAASGIAKVEPYMKGTNMALLSAFTQGMDREKRAEVWELIHGRMRGEGNVNVPLEEAIAGVVGKNHPLASAAGVEAVNTAIQNEVKDLPGPASMKRPWNGLFAAGKDLLGKTWRGETVLGETGGKIALVLGGLLAAKGVYDAFAPADEISPSDRPMPPPSSVPIGSMAPNWALPSRPIRLERPGQQAFSMGATIIEEGMNTATLMRSAVTRISDHPAYGYVEDRNIPMTDSELRYHLEQRERSAF